MLPTRQQAILKIIVTEYIDTATPVGSGSIVQRHGLGISPATVRNEMAELEEEGYISRPHTSAGGIPSQKGYRYYVATLGPELEPPTEMRVTTQSRLQEAQQDVEAWTRLAASLLAQWVRNMAVATLPKATQARWRHLEIVRMHELLALLVLVLQEAKLTQQLLPLKAPATQEELTAAANKLNALFAGLSYRELPQKQAELSPLEEQVKAAALQVVQLAERENYADHFIDGLRHMLAQPEFSEGGKARELVEALEEGELLRTVLAVMPEAGDVQVLIGEENRHEALHPLSVVVCHYGIPGEIGGTVGAIGPTRMEYAKTIGGVRYMASLMGELVQGIRGRPA